jgi:endonuclease/exonuclease/phosphatase family metal-dependent hydrolase
MVRKVSPGHCWFSAWLVFLGAGRVSAQVDYVFVSKSLVSAVVACHVVNDQAASALSDHCPVVLDLRDV